MDVNLMQQANTYTQLQEDHTTTISSFKSLASSGPCFYTQATTSQANKGQPQTSQIKKRHKLSYKTETFAKQN